MGMREISLYVLLGHLLIAGVGSVLASPCLRCDNTEQTPADKCPCCYVNLQCINGSSFTDAPSNCTKDCQVYFNSTRTEADEGDDVTLMCLHDLPDGLPLTFNWKMDDEEISGQNKSELVLKKVSSSDAGEYVCVVKSPCCTCESPPHCVTVNSNVVLLLVICGISALALVVIMGLIMKFKLKRDNAKHKQRREQRAQVAQGGGPAPFTPRES